MTFWEICDAFSLHLTLKTTPAVAIGLTDRPWTVAELLAAA